MKIHRFAIVIGLTAVTFVAGTACCAAQQGRVIDGWGEVVDPKGDCQVTNRAGTLSISVPGTYHNLNPMPGWNNLDAPRVLQEVDGDFGINVTASKFQIPAPKSALSKEKPYSLVYSGLVIWQDGENYIRYARAANGDNGKVTVEMEQFSKGKKVVWSVIEIPDESTDLSVTRTKGNYSMGYRRSPTQGWPSRLGLDLTNEVGAPLQGKVKVGVFVINATNQPINHEFTRLQLTRR